MALIGLRAELERQTAPRSAESKRSSGLTRRERVSAASPTATHPRYRERQTTCRGQPQRTTEPNLEVLAVEA